MESTSYNGKKYYLFDTFEEFVSYIKKLKISRTINKLQVHHTSAPAYENWKTDIELRRVRNTVDYHKKVFGSSDIAQHFTIFPNGKIATGRDINSTPIGVKGWNTGAICCEIYGDFDKDIMTPEQKKSVIGFYGEWCKLLKLTPSVNTIRYHCWFDARGNYLGGYDSSKSCKTCPGKKFFGGNTQSKMKENFLPQIKNYLNHKEDAPVIKETKVDKIGLVNCDFLNVRKGAGVSHSIIGKVNNNQKVTIVAMCNNGWCKIKFKDNYGYVNFSYLDNVKDNIKILVRVIVSGLNVRTEPVVDSKLVTTIRDKGTYTIVEVQKDGKGREWGRLLSGLGWICISQEYVIKL